MYVCVICKSIFSIVVRVCTLRGKGRIELAGVVLHVFVPHINHILVLFTLNVEGPSRSVDASVQLVGLVGLVLLAFLESRRYSRPGPSISFIV